MHVAPVSGPCRTPGRFPATSWPAGRGCRCNWVRGRCAAKPLAIPADRRAMRVLRRARSHARDLRQVIEVAVAVEEVQPMLDRERGRPQVVGRHRRSLQSELTEQAGVMMGRLVVGV